MIKQVARQAVGIFQSAQSHMRLVTCYFIEYSEDWSTNRSYVRAEAIEICRKKLGRAA